MIERGQVTKAETVRDCITGWSPRCHSTSNSHSLLSAYPFLFSVLESFDTSRDTEMGWGCIGWMLSLPLTSCESHDLLASNAFVSHPLKLVGKVWLYRCHDKAAHISRAYFQSHHVGILDSNQALSRSHFQCDTLTHGEMLTCMTASCCWPMW